MIRVVKYVLLCLAMCAAVPYVISFARLFAVKNSDTAQEIPVTPALAKSLRDAGFPITVNRAFEAGSYDGFHGDGTGVTVYAFPPGESEDLVYALMRKHPDLKWNQTRSGPVFATDPVWKLLPPELKPASSKELVHQSNIVKDRAGTCSYLVDLKRGTLYVVNSRE